MENRAFKMKQESPVQNRTVEVQQKGQSTGEIPDVQCGELLRTLSHSVPVGKAAESDLRRLLIHTSKLHRLPRLFSWLCLSRCLQLLS